MAIGSSFHIGARLPYSTAGFGQVEKGAGLRGAIRSSSAISSRSAVSSACRSATVLYLFPGDSSSRLSHASRRRRTYPAFSCPQRAPDQKTPRRGGICPPSPRFRERCRSKCSRGGRQQPQSRVRVMRWYSVQALLNWSKHTRNRSCRCFIAGPGQGPISGQSSPQPCPMPQKGSSQSE
jgi:hypothetical protein